MRLIHKCSVWGQVSLRWKEYQDKSQGTVQCEVLMGFQLDKSAIARRATKCCCIMNQTLPREALEEINYTWATRKIVAGCCVDDAPFRSLKWGHLPSSASDFGDGCQVSLDRSHGVCLGTCYFPSLSFSLSRCGNIPVARLGGWGWKKKWFGILTAPYFRKIP